jgi:hypothetical protein
MPALNPQDVIAEGKCYACFGMSLADLIKLTLLSNISASAPPAVFTPASISGLTLWLDASILPTVPATLQNWTDLSPAGNNLTQPTALNRPGVVAAGINSLTSVSFNGANQWIDTINLSSAILTTNAYTIFAAVNIASFPTGGDLSVPWSNSTLLGTTGGYQGMVFSTFGGIGYWSWTYSPGPTVAPVPSSAGDHVLQTRLDTGQLIASQDNSSEVSVGGAAVQNLGHTMRLGANYTNTAFFNGQIGEICCYNRVITGAERLQLLAYLQNKWIAPP